MRDGAASTAGTLCGDRHGAAMNRENALEPRRARRARRKIGEAWSPHPEGESHWQDKVLFIFVVDLEMEGEVIYFFQNALRTEFLQ
jgi:hypothetical protein